MEPQLLVWGQPPKPATSEVEGASGRAWLTNLAALWLPQLPQPIPSLIQGRILLAERKPNLLRSIPRIIVET